MSDNGRDYEADVRLLLREVGGVVWTLNFLAAMFLIAYLWGGEFWNDYGYMVSVLFVVVASLLKGILLRAQR
jgi:hypothetical protein